MAPIFSKFTVKRKNGGGGGARKKAKLKKSQKKRKRRSRKPINRGRRTVVNRWKRLK